MKIGFLAVALISGLAAGMQLPAGYAAILSDPQGTVPWGEWRRTLPPGYTSNFATVFDERRGEWVLAGMDGSAKHGEIWTSSAGSGEWKPGEATNRIAPGLTIVYTAWDGPADRLVTLLSPDIQPFAMPFVAWECVRGLGDTWRALEVSGEAPPPRLYPLVAHDPVGRRLFVFSGRGQDNQLIDDGLWMLSLTPAPHWSRVLTAGAVPRARIHAGVAFDPERQVLVLYGGEVSMDGGSVRSDAEDVWFLDLAAQPPSWRQVAETSPGPGWGLWSQAVADPSRDRLLTFSGPQQEPGTWEMSMASPGAWRRVGSGEPRTLQPAVGHDHLADALVLLTEDREKWQFDLATNAWSQIDSGSADLPLLRDAALALDPRDGSVLAMGVRELPATPAPGPTPVAHRLTRYVPGELGHWEPVIASGDPPPRLSGTAVWDSRRRRWIVLGGRDAHGPASTWVLETRPALAWRPLEVEGIGPIGPTMPALYDQARDRVVVLEEDPATRGVFQEPNSRSRVWTLSLDGPVRWELEEIVGRVPAGRYGAAPALDSRRDRMLLFGGSRFVANVSNYARDYDDVWALDLSLSLPWHEILARGNPLPESVDAGASVDPLSDRLELIGGFRNAFSGPLFALQPYERDSVRTVDLEMEARGPNGTPSGHQGIPRGRTIVDPVAGRAIHFGMGSRTAWEWTSPARHEVHVAIGRDGRVQQGRAPLELIVHGDDRFDPATIDLATVRADGVSAIASPGGERGHRDDVDGDGFADRRFLFVGDGNRTGAVVEFRAFTQLAVPVIGFARTEEDGTLRGHVAASQVGPSVRPLIARILGSTGLGSAPFLLVDGGAAALVKVQVYDVRGRRLGSTQQRRTGNEATAIELPNTEPSGPGIVFVRVQVGSESRVVRSIRLD